MSRDRETTMRSSAAPAVALGEEVTLPLSLPDGALFIAGARREDAEAAWGVDPWTHERIAPVLLADMRHAAMAAAAARTAFEATRRMPSYARRRLLKDITRGLTKAREEIASIIT